MQYSARDLAAHTRLKFRQPGQGGPNADKDALREELRRAEQEHFDKVRKERGDLSLTAEQEDFGEPETKRKRLLEEAARVASLDKDDSDDSEDESDSDDDEDDTAELIRELEKIKRERAVEKERQEHDKLEGQDRQREEEVASGNPLLNLQAGNKDFSVRRRWDDDVIFRNQARGVDGKPKPKFVNDLLRSDFHRKFLGKYIK